MYYVSATTRLVWHLVLTPQFSFLLGCRVLHLPPSPLCTGYHIPTPTGQTPSPLLSVYPTSDWVKTCPPNHASISLADLRAGGFVMDTSQWHMRILFLETLAGVPGFTAAMVRHLRSLRIMRRDGGWIHMLLEEAENEQSRVRVPFTY
jgi:hypothetical protein